MLNATMFTIAIFESSISFSTKKKQNKKEGHIKKEEQGEQWKKEKSASLCVAILVQAGTYLKLPSAL